MLAEYFGTQLTVLKSFPDTCKCYFFLNPKTAMYFIEIKNCEGTAKNQDAWRRRYSGTKNMDTLATEVALKVAHTCACFAGVFYCFLLSR